MLFRVSYDSMLLGSNCELRSKKTRHLATDADPVFELPRFTGSSYLQIRSRGSMEFGFKLEMVFKPRLSDGKPRETITPDVCLIYLYDFCVSVMFDLETVAACAPLCWHFSLRLDLNM